MTTVRYSQDGDRYTIHCSGHATGSENVCSAVSGIIYALAGYLLNTGAITTEISSLESGEAKLVFTGGIEAQTAYEMTVIGLFQLANTFPSFIEIKNF